MISIKSIQVLLLVAISLAGCQRVSVAGAPQYSVYVGNKIEVIRTCFIAREREKYVFLQDRDDFARQHYSISPKERPTYEEFDSGNWKNRAENSYEIFDVIAKGTVVVVTDIVKDPGFETGTLVYFYGSFVSDELRNKYDPILLGVYSESKPIVLENYFWKKI